MMTRKPVSRLSEVRRRCKKHNVSFYDLAKGLNKKPAQLTYMLMTLKGYGPIEQAWLEEKLGIKESDFRRPFRFRFRKVYLRWNVFSRSFRTLVSSFPYGKWLPNLSDYERRRSKALKQEFREIRRKLTFMDTLSHKLSENTMTRKIQSRLDAIIQELELLRAKESISSNSAEHLT